MAKGAGFGSSLRSVEWKEHFRAPDSQLANDLYVPALERAVHYDRCCAYFCSSVLAAASRGFGGLIRNILDHGRKMPKPVVRLLVKSSSPRRTSTRSSPEATTNRLSGSY